MRSPMKRDIWSSKVPAAKDVDKFIRAFPKSTQAKLKQLRAIIRSTAPGAEEKISYKMPVYKYNGKWLAGFAGFKNHVSLFGLSGAFFSAFQKELAPFETSKGTIRFPLDRPLPAQLIKRLIKARMKHNESS